MSENMGNSNPSQYRNAKADAKAAKAYAKASRPWYKKKRYWLLAIIVVIIIIAVSSSGGGTDESAEDTGGSGRAEDTGGSGGSDSSAPVKATKVDAGTIIKAYEENEASADAEYAGKFLEVTGEVDKVDTELLDDSEFIVRVSDGGQFAFLTVNCNDLSSDEVTDLGSGDDITVRGEFDDGGDLGVELKDCAIL